MSWGKVNFSIDNDNSPKLLEEVFFLRFNFPSVFSADVTTFYIMSTTHITFESRICPHPPSYIWFTPRVHAKVVANLTKNIQRKFSLTIRMLISKSSFDNNKLTTYLQVCDSGSGQKIFLNKWNLTISVQCLIKKRKKLNTFLGHIYSN